jgi:hypothetical protein
LRGGGGVLENTVDLRLSDLAYQRGGDTKRRGQTTFFGE